MRKIIGYLIGLFVSFSLTAQYIDMSRPNNDFSITEAKQLESRPNSINVIYINIDGMVYSGTDRANAVKAWKMAAEDYRPFEVNVTTNYNIYTNTPVEHRMKVDLNTGYNSGLCKLAGFGTGGIQCIATVDNLSHEIGHGLGLSHDGGSINSVGDYHQGNEHWGTIMGYVDLEKMGTFSNGEYPGASNQEDDLQIISEHLGFRTDDHSNTTTNASQLIIDGDSISPTENTGVIEKSDDKDVFELVFTQNSSVNLWITPLKYYNNLHAKARIYDVTGKTLFTSTAFQHQGNLSSVMQAAKIEGDFSTGTYYLEISNSGYSNESGEVYSSYGSLGYYEISGYAGVVKARADINSISALCVNTPVTLENTSLGTDLTYSWTIEGANITSSTQKSPEVTFTTKGLHKVMLTVSNNQSTSTIEKWIEVGTNTYEFIVSKEGLINTMNVDFINRTAQQTVWSIAYQDLQEKDTGHMYTATCLAEGCYDIQINDMFDYANCGLSIWKSILSYKAGSNVSYFGKQYQATQWTNKEPGEGESTWKLIGNCVSDNPLEYFTINVNDQELTKITHTEFDGNQSYTKENQCLGIITANTTTEITDNHIFPNPVTTTLNFTHPISSVVISDIYGNIVYSSDVTTQSINIKILSQGAYTIQYQTLNSDIISFSKFIKHQP